MILSGQALWAIWIEYANSLTDAVSHEVRKTHLMVYGDDEKSISGESISDMLVAPTVFTKAMAEEKNRFGRTTER